MFDTVLNMPQTIIKIFYYLTVINIKIKQNDNLDEA